MNMSSKGQADTNLLYGLVILFAGMFLVGFWAIGEVLQSPNLSGIGRVGLGLFLLLTEIINAILKGGFK